MPKAKKRKMWKSHGSSSSSKKKSKAANSNQAAALAMFQEISDTEDPELANMEGIFTLGEKLGMDAIQDIRILVLLWKMMGNTMTKPACITRDEWLQGCANLSIDSWPKLQALVPSLDTGFLERQDYKDFYKFCFQFNLQGTHKTLDKDLCVALLDLVLDDRIDGNRKRSLVDWLQNETSQNYTRITLDQWTSIYDFLDQVTDLSLYDESTSAWPVLIDEYVEAQQTKK